MAVYMYQAAYTPESWATQVKEQQDVRERVNAVIEQFGGRIINIWYAFGEYDVIGIFEMPDNVSTASVAIAFAAPMVKTVIAKRNLKITRITHLLDFVPRRLVAHSSTPKSGSESSL